MAAFLAFLPALLLAFFLAMLLTPFLAFFLAFFLAVLLTPFLAPILFLGGATWPAFPPAVAALPASPVAALPSSLAHGRSFRSLVCHLTLPAPHRPTILGPGAGGARGRFSSGGRTGKERIIGELDVGGRRRS